jgi:hypothetical protein
VGNRRGEKVCTAADLPATGRARVRATFRRFLMAYVRALSSVFDPAPLTRRGSPGLPYADDFEAFEADKRALESDWRAVGYDIQTGLSKKRPFRF